MRPQKGDSQHNSPTTFLLHVYASHSRFQPITRNLGRCREIPNFALSRRQRGFESRWGHKIKVTLTRSNALYSPGRRQAQLELRERQGSGSSAAAVQLASYTMARRPLGAASGSVPQPPQSGCSLEQLRSGTFSSVPRQMQVDRGELARTHLVTSIRSLQNQDRSPRLGVLKGIDSHTKPLHTTHQGRFLQQKGADHEPDC
jgi:hypothetical protein